MYVYDITLLGCQGVCLDQLKYRAGVEDGRDFYQNWVWLQFLCAIMEHNSPSKGYAFTTAKACAYMYLVILCMHTCQPVGKPEPPSLTAGPTVMGQV